MNMTDSVLSVFLYVCVLLSTISVFTVAVPPLPSWPETYKSCVNVYTPRETIKAGWYVDADNQRMRLDSYGIPAGFNESTVELYQYFLKHVEEFDYACSQYGPPIYEFIYYYGQGKMLTLFPDPDPPYRTCSVSTINNKFPNSPLLPNIEFIGGGRDNITHYNHWRAEFFLFTMDYLFHTANDLPYKLIVNGEENTFLSFDTETLSPETFYPPHGVTCTYETR